MLSLILFTTLLILLCFTCPLVTSTIYTIDSSKLGLPFDGIGALSAGASSRLLPDYIEPYRSHILDYLFLPGFGASLQILKVEIGGDAQSTEGTEASHMHTAGEENYERGYEWWLMKEAKQRNPHIKLYGLSWGFPAFVMEGRKHGLPLTNTTVAYTINWLLAAHRIHNLTIDYIGVWNERYYSADYIVALHSALQQHNLSSTLIVAADDCCPPWNICNDLLTNPPLSAAVSYIGGHYPNQQTTVNCSMVGQRKWSSEDFSSEYTAGGCWARLLNRNYVYAQLTASIAWSPIAAYYDELPYSRVGLMHAAQPWSGHYDVDQAIWATAHTTHHTTIGWHYLAHGNGVGELSGGGTYVALTDGQGALTIVVEAITHEQSKCINDGYAPGTAVKQEVTFALQNTIYTFSTLNSTKGTHPLPPVEQLFPSHYNDSFNTATLYGQPHYFTDQSGVFELYDSTNHSHGGTLRQSIPQLPVAWCGDAAVAYTLIGNHSWRYVRVSVDVMIEKGGMAVVSSAISTGGCTGIGGSAAISFSISSSGDWILSNSTSLLYAVASGSGQYTSGVWYWVVLSVSSVSITAVVDGSVVCEIGIEEWEYGLTGWVGLGSSFDYVQFDDFEVHGEVAVKDVQRDAVISASEHDSDVEHRHRDH